jgi:hypothetical protein
MVLVLNLAGCLRTTTPYGNFTSNSISFDEKIARDTVKQIVALYPPANTRFDLKQAVPDTDIFGTTLVSELRNKGYAILELKPGKTKLDNHAIAELATASKKAVASFDLLYILDQQGKSNLLHVMVMIDRQSLARAYIVQQASIFPAGSWVRKE